MPITPARARASIRADVRPAPRPASLRQARAIVEAAALRRRATLVTDAPRFPMRPSREVDWGAVATRYSDLVYSIPAKAGLPPDDVAEVFQNTWTVALQKAEAPYDAGMAAWLAAIASWETRHLHRKRRPQPMGDELPVEAPDPDEPEAAEILSQAEEEQAVRDALAHLPQRDRDILTDLYLADTPVPYAEIARRLGLAPGSIGMLRQRAIKRLEEFLQRRRAAG